MHPAVMSLHDGSTDDNQCVVQTTGAPSHRQPLSNRHHHRTNEQLMARDDTDPIFADEAALPSFAEMAAAQGPQPAAQPQLWSDRLPTGPPLLPSMPQLRESQLRQGSDNHLSSDRGLESNAVQPNSSSVGQSVARYSLSAFCSFKLLPSPQMAWMNVFISQVLSS